jgi:hypothetical protein
MENVAVQDKVLTFDAIKKLYPNEWVLLGNPNLKNPELNEAIVHKVVSGVVLYHSKDKREIGYRAKEVKHGFSHFVCVYTGEIPRQRRFWLSNW